MPEDPTPASGVIDQLIAGVEPAVVATTGPRYLGSSSVAPSPPPPPPNCSSRPGTSRPTTICRRPRPPSSRRSPALGSRICSAFPPASPPASSPGPRGPTRSAWPPPATRCSPVLAGTSSKTAYSRAACPGGRHRRTTRHHRPHAPPPGLRRRCPRTGRHRRQWRHRGRGAGRRAGAGAARSHHRVSPSRQREHRRLRRPGCRRPGSARARGLGACRRGLRAVGGGQSHHSPSGRGPRSRRLVGHRRTQMAQRSVRLGVRILRRSRCARGRHGLHGRLPGRRGARRSSVSWGLCPRVVTPGPGRGDLGRHSSARTHRDRRTRGPMLHAGPPG